MTTYNTGNPIGSAAAKDLFDNAENFDHALNTLHPNWEDRLGRQRKTFQGIENAVADAVQTGTATAIAVSNMFDTIDAGLASAAVPVGSSFRVKGAGASAAQEYRKVSATEAVLLATYVAQDIVAMSTLTMSAPTDPQFVLMTPSGRQIPILDYSGSVVSQNEDGTYDPVLKPSTARGVESMSPGLLDGEVITHVTKEIITGRVLEIFGADGGHWRVSLGGEITRVNGAWQSPDRAMSPGVVDGEVILRFLRDPAGNIVEAWGASGGHFVSTHGGILRRANADASLPQPEFVNYTGQTYTAGMTDLLSTSASKKRAYIFVGMGQSNMAGDNANTADALISSVPVYPDNALMLEGGPRQKNTTGAATLVSLIETAVGGERETPISGWVNHFVRDHNVTFGFMPTVVGMNVATGDRPYIGNNRGSGSWRNFENGMRNAVTALRARGFTDIETVVAWVGSESDQQTTMTVERFKRQMRQMQRNIAETVARTTGSFTPGLVLLIQPSNVLTDPWMQPARQGLLELACEQGFAFAGPAYHYAMTNSANAADTAIHRGCLGQYSVGQQLARATVAEMLGASWHGPRPTSARWTSSTTIEIDCDTMGTNIVLDNGGTISSAGLVNEGFLFTDSSAAPPQISAVATSGRKIIVTLASAPTGKSCRVGYALARNADAAGRDGPVYGARGRLRDDAAHTRISDGISQYNWMPAFIINIA